MKFSAILLLALIGFAACQRNADLQKCVDDIQDSVGMIKSTAHDIQQHHYLQALHHIKQLVADVEDEHEVCANITIQDLEKYIYDHLPEKDKECITAAATFYLECKTIEKDIQAHNYADAIRQIKPAIEDAKAVEQKCENHTFMRM